MTSVEPANGKVGAEVTVTGENLEKKNVSDVFLTDGSIDLKVVISEQTATAVKFKIPAKATAGRWALMVLTPGKEPKLIEQPVKLTVDE
ncbi:MAG: IPT/TIG domain-containing protein [Acidobacteriota bacterium]